MSAIPPALAALLGVATWPDAPRARRALVAATPDADAGPLLRWSYDRARGAAARPTLAAWAAVLGVAPSTLRGRVWRMALADALPVARQPTARHLSEHPDATRSRDYRARVAELKTARDAARARRRLATGDVAAPGRPPAPPLDDPEAQRRREADTARAAARRAAAKKAAKKRRKTPSV